MTNASSGVIGGYGGVAITAGTIVNSGSIRGADVAGYAGFGAALQGGAVTNAAGGVVTGSRGVYVAAGTGTIFNMGYIAGASYGILVGAYAAGARINNAAGGTITGYAGISLMGTCYVLNQQGGVIQGTGFRYGAIAAYAGTDRVVNAGLIESGKYALGLFGSGTIVNRAGGTITGGIGIYLFSGNTIVNASGALVYGYAHAIYGYHAAGTIENAGTIAAGPAAGARGAAIDLSNSTTTLDVDQGAVFWGKVYLGGGTLAFGTASLWRHQRVGHAVSGLLRHRREPRRHVVGRPPAPASARWRRSRSWASSASRPVPRSLHRRCWTLGPCRSRRARRSPAAPACNGRSPAPARPP